MRGYGNVICISLLLALLPRRRQDSCEVGMRCEVPKARHGRGRQIFGIEKCGLRWMGFDVQEVVKQAQGALVYDSVVVLAHVCSLAGELDGVIQVADLVDQAVLLGLVRSEDAAIGKVTDIGDMLRALLAVTDGDVLVDRD